MKNASSSTTTPSESGFQMPAEWQLHAATQLHWPSNLDTWPGEHLNRVEDVYLDIIETLHVYEPIVLLAQGPVLRHAELRLREREIDMGRVHLFDQPVNDVWARDCGPVFVGRPADHGQEYAVIDWGYNAWGGKYPPFDDDNALPGWFSEAFGLSRYDPGMVLEGGSIEVNGQGLLLTTESVLLHPNRNPGLTKHEIETRLMDFLGAVQIIWLKDGLVGDDTDGHIDDIARFVNEDTIVISVIDDPDDVNYRALQENLSILRSSSGPDGHPLHIETLPLPRTRIEGLTVDGSPYVPASYANFYIANGVVLVPLYDERFDEQVLEAFRGYFPDRDIRGIPCVDLVFGQGSIHCITQQLYGIDFG